MRGSDGLAVFGGAAPSVALLDVVRLDVVRLDVVRLDVVRLDAVLPLVAPAPGSADPGSR